MEDVVSIPYMGKVDDFQITESKRNGIVSIPYMGKVDKNNGRNCN